MEMDEIRRCYHKDNYKMCEYVLNKSPMMHDAAARSLLALLMINKPIGESCLKARADLLKYHHVFTKADYSFTTAVFVYNLIAEIAMKNIITKMIESRDIKELYVLLSPLGRCWVYSQVMSALAYYDSAIETIKILPIKSQSIIDGFYVLKDLRKDIEKLFRPPRIVETRLKYTIISDSDWTWEWFVCKTDLDWSKAFVSAIKSQALSETSLLPLYYLVSLLERFLQSYFDLYTEGTLDIIHCKTMTDSVKTVLYMCLYNDVINYYEIELYYNLCLKDTLPDTFFKELDVFCLNINYTLNRFNKLHLCL